jgi:hypothetical protein
MLGAAMQRIRGKALPAAPEGEGDELEQALGQLAQRRSDIAGRINALGQEDTAPLRADLERVALDQDLLVKARNRRAGVLPEAARIVARVLGLAPADRDPETTRLEGEIERRGRAGKAEAEQLRGLILKGMAHGPAAEQAREQIPNTKERIAELGRKQGAARQALNERRAAIGDAQKAEAARDRAAKPRRLAELRRRCIDRAGALDSCWEQTAAAMAEDDADRAEIAALLGLAGGGFFTQGAFRSRAQGAAAKALMIDAGRPMSEHNSLLGIKSPYRDPRALWSLVEHTANALKTELLFFESRQEAEDAAEALSASGSEMIVVGLGGAFTLVDRRHAFVDRDEAAGALERMGRIQGGADYVIVNLPVGCAILPPHLVE